MHLPFYETFLQLCHSHMKIQNSMEIFLWKSKSKKQRISFRNKVIHCLPTCRLNVNTLAFSIETVNTKGLVSLDKTLD
jgi:hypothetical protein